MIYYMDTTWCRCEHCKKYNDCEKAQPYAMRKQAKEVPNVRSHIPYAVRDMSDVCGKYEAKPQAETWVPMRGGNTMNLIPKIAELLGVEIGEEFKLSQKGEIICNGASLMFNEAWLLINGKDTDDWQLCDNSTLHILLNGYANIVKLPFKPKEHERYWYVYVGDDEIGNTRFSEANTNDLMRVYCSNCFRTKAEAEAHKYEIYEKLTGKKWVEVAK